jgi:serine protease
LTIPAERAARKAALAAERLHPHATSSSTLSAHGGTNGVETDIGQPKIYVVFYGSQWGTDTVTGGYDTFSGDPQGLAPRLEALYAGLGTNGEGWSGVLTQYCDGVASGTTTCAASAVHVPYPSANVLSGVWYDNAAASPTNATGNQLALEANAAAAHFGNTTQALNRNAQYIIVSPTGTHPDGFNTPTGNYCAYHDYNTDPTMIGGGAAPSTYGTFAWTNQPYLLDLGRSCGANYVNAGTAGLLDGVTIVAGHEYAESMTDLWPSGGWYATSTGKENGDLCAWVGTGGTGGAQNVAFATGIFAMQASWSNANNACAISFPTVTTQPFTVSLSSAAGTVTQGGSATTTVATSAVTPSTIALAASGVPAGVTATFSSASVASGSSSTLTLATTSSTTAGTYPIVVTCTANGVSQSAKYTLTVSVPGTLGLSLSTSSAGLSASTVASPTISSGPAVATTLTASGLPTGVKATFAPASLNTGSTSTVTFATATSTAVGTYSITVIATSGALTASKVYTLMVTAYVANSYALSLSPTSGTTNLGGSITSTLTSTVSSGTGQTVSLSASGTPSGVSITTSATLVTGGSVTLRFQVSNRARHGTYPITILGTTGTLKASVGYTLTF